MFVSPNQPALFPMAVSSPSISREDYHLFYKKDRSLFTILLVVLHREVVQSILVMGFLLWLEREGYTSKNLVETIIGSLTRESIDRVADEVVICLKFLEKKSNKFVFKGSYDISLLQCFLDRKSLHLEDLYRDRGTIFDEVSRIANEVSNKAFDDILERFIRCGEPLVVHTPQEVNVGGGVGGFRYVGPVVAFPSYDVSKYDGFYRQMIDGGVEDAHQQALVTLGVYLREQRNSVMNRLNARNHSASVVRDSKEEIPQENRTIFLTFSKGYPISENEVREYFTRIFGDFIETIFMQPVEPENQPLFARIVARTPTMVSEVVDRDGADGKSKYYINGKHVWARKYVKRTPSKDANEGVESSQP
ncbi:hypothetical protein L1987_52213 [Smallanthus sonchifolius]|uniref:Uncharacterized protein n=1 Tax=Smallanthus sonchifolius TaxID=185202 RepID=A0ACB9ESU2_9ASTR|nr:hypothetical protein L1987_52213 [Smallanthus sonchifolius]